MNEAGEYIEREKQMMHHNGGDSEYMITVQEAQEAVNKALEQVRQKALDKTLHIGLIEFKDLEKIINSLKL